VTLATSPSISAFNVWVEFDPNVLNASTTAISYSGNVLGSDAQVQSECINNQAISGVCQPYPLGGPGVVNLGLFYLGGKTTSNSTSGLLYTLTLTVIKSGSFSQLHILQVALVNGVKNVAYPSTTVDSFFTNRLCGLSYCKPPLVDFTYSPSQPSIGATVTFNASTSKATNPNAILVDYNWSWNEICGAVSSTQLVHVPTITHTFCNKKNYSVTLIVTDSLGISWAITKSVQVIYVFVDVTYGTIDLDHRYNVYPGTIVHISAGIVNNSTLPAKGNLTLTLDTGLVLGNKTFNLSERGGVGSTTGTLGPVRWDTTNYPPRVYRIEVRVASDVHQNVTTDKLASAYVQLIVIQPGGSFSLSLFQATGLGVIVILGLAAGLARFRKKPSWETEPLSSE
jgi:hypothetical protein